MDFGRIKNVKNDCFEMNKEQQKIFNFLNDNWTLFYIFEAK
jgi:hypothetical protein